MSFNEWTSIKLGELIESISIKHDFEKDELIFLNTSDVLEGKVLHDNYSEVSKMPGQAKKSIQKGDILFSEIRPKNKRFAYIDFDAKDFVVSTKLMVLRRKSSLINNKFLYKLLTSDRMLNYLQHIAEGRSGTFPQITFSELKNIYVLLPSIQEQIAIAKTLDDLDGKIEINNKINKALEEMAQAIFKQWFVDFEFPNEEGKPYKSSGGEMVESELGMIPKGWEAGNFREFTDTVLGGDWGKETEQGNYNKEVLCLRGADIPEIKCGKLGAPAKRFILERNYNNKKLNVGDLVVEISGGSPTQSTGRVTYVNEGILNRYDYDFVCTNFCRAITLKNKKYMEYFYFYWSYLYDLNVFFQYENGTTGIKNFDVNTFLDKHQIIIPPHYLLEKYHLIVSNKLNTIQHNGLENLKLGNIRDTLLPKLMSGEIRVPLGLIEN